MAMAYVKVEIPDGEKCMNCTFLNQCFCMLFDELLETKGAYTEMEKCKACVKACKEYEEREREKEDEKIKKQAKKVAKMMREGKPIKLRCASTGEVVVFVPVDNSELSSEGRKLLGIEEEQNG